GSSNNTTLVPNNNIVLGGAGNTRTVAVTPAVNQSGTATITVVVTDANGATAAASFDLTVNAPVQNGSPTTTFANATPITIPNKGAAKPYGSAITVSATTGTLTSVSVRLNGFSHTRSRDVDILLVSPTGQKILLMSDAGGASANVNLTFS